MPVVIGSGYVKCGSSETKDTVCCVLTLSRVDCTVLILSLTIFIYKCFSCFSAYQIFSCACTFFCITLVITFSNVKKKQVFFFSRHDGITKLLSTNPPLHFCFAIEQVPFFERFFQIVVILVTAFRMFFSSRC